jgi:hypothetical protein
LRDVDFRLTEALRECGYEEKRYFSIPDGFALVTKMERIDSTGRPQNPRWVVDSLALRDRFTLRDYIVALLGAPRGLYRVIVFAITSTPFATTGDPISRDEADRWLTGGLNILPRTIGALALTENHSVSVLVYEFEKQGHAGEVEILLPGRLQGETHMAGSGLRSALARGRR